MEDKMKKIAVMFLIMAMVFAFAACSHEHTPGPAATCITAQVCTDCGDVLVDATGHREGPEATCTTPQTCTGCDLEFNPAFGHTPGAEATCTDSQLCETCGEVLEEAFGHSMNEENACDTCELQIVPANQKFIKAGRNGALSDDISDIIPETESGHYNNNISAYYSGAVLVCGDYGLEYFLPSENGNGAWANTVNKFAEKYPEINTTALLVPKSCTFNFPEGYTDPYEKTKAHIDATYGMLNEGIKTADCLGIMTEHSDEYLFYRTDHHWTSLGAYYASVAFCNANEIESYALDTYETVIKTGFIGTLYNYAGGPSVLESNPDYSVAHYPHVGYSMVYGSYGYMYNGTALNANSRGYAGMFIGGDNPVTVFTTENKNGRTLLIFKESYGNAFVPYMIDYFEQVVVVDIRKDSETVKSIVEKYNVTDALIINNVQAAISLQPQLHAKALS